VITRASLILVVALLSPASKSWPTEEPSTCALVEVGRGGDYWINGEPHALLDVHDPGYRTASDDTLMLLMPEYDSAMADALALFREAAGLQQEDPRFSVLFVFPTDRQTYMTLFGMDPLSVRGFLEPPLLRFAAESPKTARDFDIDWVVAEDETLGPEDSVSNLPPSLLLWNASDDRLHGLFVGRDGSSKYVRDLSDLTDWTDGSPASFWRIRMSQDVAFGVAEQIAWTLGQTLRRPYTTTIRDAHDGFTVLVAEADHYVPAPPQVDRLEVLKPGSAARGAASAEPKAPVSEKRYHACYIPGGRRHAELRPD